MYSAMIFRQHQFEKGNWYQNKNLKVLSMLKRFVLTRIKAGCLKEK